MRREVMTMAEATANARDSIGAVIAASLPLGAGMALVRWKEPDQHLSASATNNTKR